MQTRIFTYNQSFPLEQGGQLPEFQLTYSTIGKLNKDKSNVVWVCHALTANSVVTDWWPDLIGPGKLFDPEHYFIVCANMLGSCYGSTDALAINPSGGEPYYHDFPLLTNRDIIRAFDLLRQELDLPNIHVVLGGSMGGQQTLEWAIMQPDVFEYLIPIATNARHSAWGIAFNESQRMAIAADSTWKNKDPQAGQMGMRAARSVALLSYRGYPTYHQTQTEEDTSKIDDFRASSYQQYQGDKLVKRFHAFAYWSLSKAMDSHHVGRKRESIEHALAQIKAKTLVVGVSSDVLFPVAEQKLLASLIKNARYAEIDSIYGHDGFLIEFGQLTQIISDFLPSTDPKDPQQNTSHLNFSRK